MNDLSYDTLISRMDFLDGIYQSKKSQIEKTEKEVKSLETEANILEKTEKIIKHLIDIFAEKDMSKMDKLVTYGLNTIFPDRDIKFKSRLIEYGSKMRISLNTLYKDQEVDPSDKGSITVIESFLLRVLCLMKLKRAPFLYMDEPFGAVDSGYVERVSPLIAEITNKLNMDILLVTHNPIFMEDAKKCYRIKIVKEKPILEKIKK